jgi:hypothetical protein
MCLPADDSIVVVRAASRVEPPQNSGEFQLSFTSGFVVDRYDATTLPSNLLCMPSLPMYLAATSYGAGGACMGPCALGTELGIWEGQQAAAHSCRTTPCCGEVLPAARASNPCRQFSKFKSVFCHVWCTRLGSNTAPTCGPLPRPCRNVARREMENVRKALRWELAPVITDFDPRFNPAAPLWFERLFQPFAERNAFTPSGEPYPERETRLALPE